MRRHHLWCQLIAAGALIATGGCTRSREPGSIAPDGGVTGASSERAGYIASIRRKYDPVYTERQDKHIDEPNAFLDNCLDRIQRTRTAEFKTHQPSALDVGMGEGRNTILLAQRGFRAAGIDVSRPGLERALAKASEAGVEIEAIEADAVTFNFGTERWDAVALIYFSPSDKVLEHIKASVKPGGWIITEFMPGHSWDSRAVALNHVLERFDDWHITVYEYDVLTPDWHWGKPGEPRPLVRLMARRPR